MASSDTSGALGSVQLPFFPSTTNCIAWSEDGELAIAAGEYVHILVPNRSRKLRNAVSGPVDPWIHVRIRVNKFTVKEWPIEELASFDSFSIGEEQSLSIVTALVWSPPGLAKHRRCALTVLTSNLLLSIWSSSSNMADATSWQRVLVVNYNIKLGYNEAEPPTGDMLRKRRRIRAMAWAEPLTYSSNDDMHRVMIHNRFTEHVLAITNDLHAVDILIVTSPYLYQAHESPHRKWRKWRVESVYSTVGHPKANELLQNDHTLMHLNSLRVSDSLGGESARKGVANWISHRFNHELAWSPWKRECLGVGGRVGGPAAYLSCRILGYLAVHRVQLADGYSKGSDMDFPLDHIDCNVCLLDDHEFDFPDGPLAWDKHVMDGWKLALGETHGVDIYHCWDGDEQSDGDPEGPQHKTSQKFSEVDKRRWKRSILGGSESELTAHPWDLVSGLCFFQDPQADHALLCVTTHLSDIEMYCCEPNDAEPSLKLLQQGKETQNISRYSRPYTLKGRMLACRRRFDLQHKLGDMITMKTWGVGGFDGFIAACITLQPSDMVEYTIPSNERTTVVFSHASLEDNITNPSQNQTLSFPWCAERGSKEQSKALAPPWSTIQECSNEQSLNKSYLSFRIAYSVFLGSLLWQRYETLEFTTARGFLDRFAHAYGTDFDEERRYLLHLHMTATETMPMRFKTLNDLVRIRSIAEAGLPAAYRILDYCQVKECGKPLWWIGLSKSRCSSGHRWNRCTLTFLAIQEPGLSRYCDTCEREYLDEEKLLKTDTERIAFIQSHWEFTRPDEGVDHDPKLYGDDDRFEYAMKAASSTSVAQFFFKIHDVCIHCSGKFIG